jgi:hypothetical protein
MANKPTEIESQPHNSTYPKVAVQWLNQALCFYQSFCLVDSEVLRNRHFAKLQNVSNNNNQSLTIVKQEVKQY